MPTSFTTRPKGSRRKPTTNWASLLNKTSALAAAVPWPRAFVLVAGGIFLFGAASKLLGFPGKMDVLGLTDPLVGIPFRYVYYFAGVLQLAAACVCLFTKRTALGLAFVLWLSSNWIVYRIGLWSMDWRHPYVWLGNMMDWLGVSPLAADWITSVTSVCLFLGSGALLWILRERAVEFLKMSCPRCDGHIAFPAHGLGRSIVCPHCACPLVLQLPRQAGTSCK